MNDSTATAAPIPMTPKRALRTCLVASSFVLFWSVAFYQAWIGFPLKALFLRDEVQRIRACQRTLVSCFRFFHWYMRSLGLFDAQLRFDIPREGYQGPLVIVANHTTLVDVTAILTAYPHTCCIVNPIYYHNPLIGRAARLAGFIAGRARAGDSSAPATALERLEQGFNVLVFPEGTRSPPGGLLPFHRGAFEIAKRAKVPVAPLLLQCRPNALTKGQPISQLPAVVARLTVTPQPLVPTAEHTGTSRDLCEAVHKTYHAALFAREHAGSAGSVDTPHELPHSTRDRD